MYRGCMMSCKTVGLLNHGGRRQHLHIWLRMKHVVGARQNNCSGLHARLAFNLQQRLA
jgi:hypothetical protein